MSYIQITNLSATPNQINPGDHVQLSYSLDGDDGAQLTLTYLINADNNIYFLLNNGTVTKTITDPYNLSMPPVQVPKDVVITKVTAPGKQDFGQFDLYVKAINTVNGNLDIKHCPIAFK